MNTPSSAKDVVLITGASSGIGLALAREFARHNHDLALVSPVASEIGGVAEQIHEEFAVTVAPIAVDLTLPTAAEVIAGAIAERGLRVTILANNAGVGHRGKFADVTLERDIEMIRLDVEAPVRMAKQFLPGMIHRGSGRLLNVSSIAAFEPGPMLAVYHASKAFVLSWSEALATELEGTGVTVTALCPGPVDTDFFPKAGMEDTNVFQKGNVMAPREVAETAYEALMSEERVIVPGAVNKTMAFATRFLSESAQASKNAVYYNDADQEDRKRKRGDVEAVDQRSSREHTSHARS